jgi:beta-galactosidase
LPPLSLPDPSTKRKYASINVTAVNTIFSQSGRQHLGSNAIDAGGRLKTFEELDQFSGFVLYETTLPKTFSRDPSNLVVEKLRDRALVYIDERYVGALSRENSIKSLPLSKGHAGKKLQILVENQGRINFQENFDLKGILGNVTMQIFEEPYYEELSDWTITGYPFEEYSDIEAFTASNTNDCSTCSLASNGWLKNGPTIFNGTLTIGVQEEIADTWWSVRGGWGKGSLFVNGVNLGRYWSVGPQMTMYIAKEFLVRGNNEITILELQKAPLDLKINFADEADYNED